MKNMFQLYIHTYAIFLVVFKVLQWQILKDYLEERSTLLCYVLAISWCQIVKHTINLPLLKIFKQKYYKLPYFSTHDKAH